jgi:hypothetical protein
MLPTIHCKYFWTSGACPGAFYPTAMHFVVPGQCCFCNAESKERVKDEQENRNDAHHDQRNGKDASSEKTSGEKTSKGDRNGEEAEDNTEQASSGSEEMDTS